MKELDIIRHAKNYMESLSKRINPITKAPYDEKSDMNNERLLKCFDYVASLLDRIIIEEEQKEKCQGENKALEKPFSYRGSEDGGISFQQKPGGDVCEKTSHPKSEQGKVLQGSVAFNDEQRNVHQGGVVSNGEQRKVSQNGVAFNGEQRKVSQNGVAFNGEQRNVHQNSVANPQSSQTESYQNSGISANDEPKVSPLQEATKGQDVGDGNAYVKYDYVSNEPIVPNSIVPDDVMGKDVVDMLMKKGLIKQGAKK